MALRRRWPLITLGLALVGLFLLLFLRGALGARLQGAPLGAVTVEPEAAARTLEFVEANQRLSTRSREVEARLEKARRSHKPGSAALEAELAKGRDELNRLRKQELGPLQDRLNRAMAEVAARRGASVVLDRRVVLEGLPDVTEQVVERFREPGRPPRAREARGGVAFVDQQKIAQLPLFDAVEKRLIAYHEQLGREFRRRQAGLSEPQQEELDRMLGARFDERRAELYGPLQARVRDTIVAVAREEGLDLVLDRRQILWGGRDLTPEVSARLASEAPPRAVGERRERSRIGIVSVVRVLDESPEFREHSQRYGEEWGRLLEGVDGRDPWDVLSQRRDQVSAEVARWTEIRQAFIASTTEEMQTAARKVARDKRLAFVLMDAPWYPGFPLGQFGAEDVTTDVLFAMKEQP